PPPEAPGTDRRHYRTQGTRIAVNTSPAVSRSLPWRLGDLVTLWVPLVAGAVILLMSWWGASATATLSTQIFWLDVGVAGVIVTGVGVVFWLVTGRRAIGERRRRLLPNVPSIMNGSSGRALRAVSDELVSGPRLTRYHRGDCPLVAQKPTHRTS